VTPMKKVLFLTVMIAWVLGAGPQVLGDGSFNYNLDIDYPGDILTLSFQIFNTSPESGPNLTSFSIADFYSVSAPTFSSLPAGWSGTATLTSLCFYTATFSLNNPGAAIAPGGSLNGFAVQGTKPDSGGWYGENVPYTVGFSDNSTSVDPDGFGAYSTVVPEPASDSLVWMGILALVFASRHWKLRSADSNRRHV